MGNRLPKPLKAVEQITVVALMDNYSDVLLESGDIVTRPPNAKNGLISEDTLVAEHGLSLLVTVVQGEERHSILFDAGHTEIGVPHNLNHLGLDLGDIEAIVLSHGHMDHTGALYPILKDLPRPVPLVVHPAAFQSPRYKMQPSGRLDRFPDTLKREELAAQRIEILESPEPVPLANGMILVTGEVDRTTAFEKGFPPAKMERNGELVQDPISDDQSLVVHLRGKGLVVISGCAHSGIVNTIHYARKITGIKTIHAILGGFHLGGRLFEPIIGETIAAIKEFDPKWLVPMHCTGWKATQKFSEAFPSAFVLNSVGSTYLLS